MRFAIRIRQARQRGEVSPRTWSRVLVVGLAATMAGLLWTGPADADSIVTPEGVEYEEVYIRATEHLYYIQVPDTGEIVTVRRDEVDSDDVQVHEDPDYREQLLREWHEARGLEREDPEAQAEERIEELTPEEPVVEPPEPTPEATDEDSAPEPEAERPQSDEPREDIGRPESEPESEETEPVGQPEGMPEIEMEEPIIDEPLNDFSIPGEAPLSEGENGAMDEDQSSDSRDPIEISVPDEERQDSAEGENGAMDEALSGESQDPIEFSAPGEERQDSAEGENVAMDEELSQDSQEPIEISVPEDERQDSAEDRRRLMEIRQMFRQMKMQQQFGGQQPGMGGPQQQQPGGPQQQQPGAPQQQQPGGPQQQQPGGPQQQPGAPGPAPGGSEGEGGAPAPSPSEGDEPE